MQKMDECARQKDDIMEGGEGGLKDHEPNNQSTCAFAISSRARRRPDPNRPLKTIGIKQRGR